MTTHPSTRPQQLRLGGVWSVLVIALGCSIPTYSQPQPAEVTVPVPELEILARELDRSFDQLGQEELPPYFISYELTEINTHALSASFGQIVRTVDDRSRQLDVDLRVGDYQLDNTHPQRGDRFGRSQPERYAYVEMPLEADPVAMSRVLWLHTDHKYKRAIENLTAVRTNVQVKVEEADTSPDFSPQEAVIHIEEPRQAELDVELWRRKLERYSRPFASHGQIYQASAELTALGQVRWYVNTEGSRVRDSRVAYRLAISAFTKADDGMELPRYESFFAYSADGLPGDDVVLATVEKMITDLEALRTAPVVEPYTGPAILSGRAAGVFFHEVLGHRIEGHRQKIEEDGQTFKSKVGEAVLPASFSVLFDPTRRRQGEVELAGHYRVDNEGVVAQPVAVIEDGVFRRFLMSRSPIEGEPASNGHGRKQPGFQTVSRQSNLIVEARDAVPRTELKKMLLARLEQEGKPFGLLFEDIQGGYTLTGRRVPNAFNVLPILVFKIYPDGREELVRGVDLIGTPLTAFSQIVAADQDVAVFNGTCGAESGGVPVSAASPGILVGRVEVQKQEKSQERPPLLPPPWDENEVSAR